MKISGSRVGDSVSVEHECMSCPDSLIAECMTVGLLKLYVRSLICESVVKGTVGYSDVVCVFEV